MDYFTDTDLKKLWKPAKNSRFTLPFPNEEDFAALEKRLGVKLPASYIELAVSSQNGGFLKRNAIPICDEYGNVIRYAKINYINPIGRTDIEPIYDTPKPFYDVPNLLIIGENWDTYYDFYVLNYMDCKAYGEPTVALITRKAKCKDTKVPDVSDWRYINEKYYWEIECTVAKTFDEFIKKLVVMPKSPPFDFASIKEPLKQAAQESFRQIVKEYDKEEIVSFGLYVDDEGSMVSDAANTKSHLDELAAKYPSDKDYCTYCISE